MGSLYDNAVEVNNQAHGYIDEIMNKIDQAGSISAVVDYEVINNLHTFIEDLGKMVMAAAALIEKLNGKLGITEETAAENIKQLSDDEIRARLKNMIPGAYDQNTDTIYGMPLDHVVEQIRAGKGFSNITDNIKTFEKDNEIGEEFGL